MKRKLTSRFPDGLMKNKYKKKHNTRHVPWVYGLSVAFRGK